MRDTDELRQALAAETADLAVHLPPDLIRRRARRVRMRQVAGMAAAGVLAVVAVAVPTVMLANGPSPGYDVAGQMPVASVPACPTPTPGDPKHQIDPLGPFVDTGVTFDATNLNTRYDVLLGLTGPREHPGFVIAFRDRNTGAVEPWNTSGLARDPNGDFPGGKWGDGPGLQFHSAQLDLGPHSVLDVGLYTRAAHHITVASEGRATEARTARNAETGWTFFWVQRAAAPLPPGHDTTPVEYTGPEQLTITAYDAEGRPQHRVTGGVFVGHHVQNPRDHTPPRDNQAVDASTPPATAVPTCPPAGTPK